MHRTKRLARNLASQDNKNPFARRCARKIVDPHSSAEIGDGSALFRPNTDDPSDYVPQHSDTLAQEWRQEGNSRQHAATVPATSRRRPNEPGDSIGELTLMASPSSEKVPMQNEPGPEEKSVQIVNGNDKAPSDQTHNHEKSEKRGLRGWLQGTTTDKREHADNEYNNGKTKPEKKFTPWSQIKATLFNSWINVLLVASPAGIAVYYAHVNPIVVFVVNFIAIIPLAALLSYATEEIALRTGEVVGGLLNASFGNAVELIVTIIALVDDQILIVQTSLIGSMLSNLLLVLGMCFFAGGVNRMEQAFNMTVAQTAASLLFLAVSSLLIPTAFYEWANTGQADRSSPTGDLASGEAALSRATAILLLIVYACYLFFQLKSHTKMYSQPSEKNEKRDFTKQKKKAKKFLSGKARRRSLETASNQSSEACSDNGEEEPEEPQLSIWVALALLAASTALVALNAEYLVDSIDAITCDGGISKNFVGLILLPIVGNAAEHATAVTVAIKDKMDLAIGVAVGSSMQIALLVLPLAVVLGWIIGKDDMTLHFDGFQIAVLFVAVLLVNYLIQDGKSHWLEGVLLMITYVIIAVAAWFYPPADGLNNCPPKT